MIWILQVRKKINELTYSLEFHHTRHFLESLFFLKFLMSYDVPRKVFRAEWYSMDTKLQSHHCSQINNTPLYGPCTRSLEDNKSQCHRTQARKIPQKVDAKTRHWKEKSSWVFCWQEMRFFLELKEKHMVGFIVIVQHFSICQKIQKTCFIHVKRSQTFFGSQITRLRNPQLLCFAFLWFFFKRIIFGSFAIKIR